MAALFAFMVPRVDFTRIDVFKVGPPANFPPNTVDESFKAAHRCWIVNHDHKVFCIQAGCAQPRPKQGIKINSCRASDRKTPGAGKTKFAGMLITRMESSGDMRQTLYMILEGLT